MRVGAKKGLKTAAETMDGMLRTSEVKYDELYYDMNNKYNEPCFHVFRRFQDVDNKELKRIVTVYLGLDEQSKMPCFVATCYESPAPDEESINFKMASVPDLRSLKKFIFDKLDRWEPATRWLR